MKVASFTSKILLKSLSLSVVGIESSACVASNCEQIHGRFEASVISPLSHIIYILHEEFYGFDVQINYSINGKLPRTASRYTKRTPSMCVTRKFSRG